MSQASTNLLAYTCEQYLCCVVTFIQINEMLVKILIKCQIILQTTFIHSKLYT